MWKPPPQYLRPTKGGRKDAIESGRKVFEKLGGPALRACRQLSPPRWALLTLAASLLLTCSARAEPKLRIMPPNQSRFAVGQRFDLRVEASGLPEGSAELTVELNGQPLEKLEGIEVKRTSTGTGKLEVFARDVSFPTPLAGQITAAVRHAEGVTTADNRFEVVQVNGPATRAKNVILMIGDGMGLAHRVAARVVARGLRDGRYNDRLEMEEMDALGLASTPSLDALVTDSANGGTAYAGGNKVDNGSLCVWPDNTSDPMDNPRFENLMSYARRSFGKAIGVVSTSTLTDATPAAFLAYSYTRDQTAKIAAQYPGAAPEVLMGGGRSAFTTAIRTKFADAGYASASTVEELQALPLDTLKCLGLFSNDVMASYVDRLKAQQAGTGAAAKEPSLVQMTESALAILSRYPQGFVLMVEGASIDKQSHATDTTRAIWETIEFDRAVGVAKQFAASRGDTLVVVTADHETGGMTITGLTGGTAPKLQTGWGTTNVIPGEGMLEPVYVAPRSGSNGHTGVDVPVTASGVGATQFRGSFDATDVFFGILKALGGGYDELSSSPSTQGDMDSNGKLEIRDAHLLLRRIVGLQGG